MIYTDKYFNDIQLASNKIIKKSDLQNKSILITGSCGLIGSALIDMLITLNEREKLNIQIYAASRSVQRLKNRFESYFFYEYFHCIEYDALLPFNYSKRVDYIIHTASNAHPSAIIKQPVETMMSNLLGTYYLLEYAKNMGVQRTLFISSSEVYGNRKANVSPYGEDDYSYVDLLNIRSCYPSSKRAAETLCCSYMGEYNLETVIVRPGHVYGPTQTEEDSRASAQFLRSAVNKTPIIMKSGGHQLRSYCHCFDCASAILTVLLIGKTGEAYNISNKNSIVSIREFAQECSSAGKVELLSEKPVEGEQRGYNVMECSALKSDKIENLGWMGVYPLQLGIMQSVYTMRGEENNA